MRIFLTGAAGRLSSAVCRHLAAEGHEVVATDQVYRGDLPVKLRVADLLDRHAVYGLLDGCEAVVHLANHAHMGRVSPPQRLYAENVTMNVNVFHAAVEAGIKRLVFASSIQAIAGDRQGLPDDAAAARPSCLPYLPLDEHVPACPGNLYALSKAAGEQMLALYARLDPSLSCTAIRFPSLWRTEWLEHYRRYWHGSPLNLDEAFCYLEMRDAVTLVARVLATGRPGYIHFVPAARNNSLGWPPAEVIARFYQGVPLRRPADQMTALVDLEALERYYGWTPRHEVELPRRDG